MTGEPITAVVALKSAVEAIAAIWARGALVLWCLATTCGVVILALIAGAHWQVGDAPALLSEHRTELVLAFIVLFVCAAFKTYGERPKPILSLLPQESGSFCSQAREADGRIFTLLALRFQATNLTDGTIMLSAIKLRRPFVRRRAILTKNLMVLHPNGKYSSKNPIDAGTLAYGSADIIIAHPVGSMGKTMRAAIALQDHTGRWHKLVFPHLPISGGDDLIQT